MSRRQDERLHDDVHFMKADINRVCRFQLDVIIVSLNTRIKVHQRPRTNYLSLPLSFLLRATVKLDCWFSVWGCSDMENFCKSGPGSKSWVNALAVPLFPFYNARGYGRAKSPSCSWVADDRLTASPCPDFPFWLRRGVKFDTSRFLNHGVCPRIFPNRLSRTLASFK